MLILVAVSVNVVNKSNLNRNSRKDMWTNIIKVAEEEGNSGVLKLMEKNIIQ